VIFLHQSVPVLRYEAVFLSLKKLSEITCAERKRIMIDILSDDAIITDDKAVSESMPGEIHLCLIDAVQRTVQKKTYACLRSIPRFFYTYRLKVEMLIYEDKKHEIDRLFLI
jgi:hypothetical protein